MDRSLLRTVCLFFVLVHRCDLGILSRIYHSLSMKLGGKWIVGLTVSTIQLRKILMLSQMQSP